MLDHDFTIDPKLQFNQSILTTKYNKEQVLDFLNSVEQFAVEAKFLQFYQKNKLTYQSWIDRVVEQIKGQSQIPELEAFYGEKKASYNIVLAPNFHDGGFGPSVFTKSGREHVYSVNGPTAMTNLQPDFGDQARTLDLVNHEFSHSFLREPFDTYASRIEMSNALLHPIKAKMKKQGYSTWKSVLNEHFVRAVTVTLSFNKGPEQGQKALEYEYSRDYIYIDDVLDTFKIYQENRTEYPNFNSYFERALEHVEKLKTS